MIALLAVRLSAALQTKVIGYYPEEGKPALQVRGDGCGLSWNKGVPASRVAKDTFQLTLDCNTSFSLKFLLNDTWMMGKNVLAFAGQTNQVYPSFNPKINPVVKKSISSKKLGNTRNVGVYLPPSFFDNVLKPYPVLLMHDGQNLYNNSEAAFGRAWLIQDTLNQLILTGQIEEVVVLGVWNTPDRNNEYTYSRDPEEGFGGKGDLYLDFLVQELLPVASGNWLSGRVTGSPSIGGSSLGGLISCYALYTRPTVFSKAICMSPSFWWNNQDFHNQVLAAKHVSVIFYLDSGDSGPSADGMQQTATVRDDLARMGYSSNKTLFYYLDHGGQHSQAYWGKRFHVPLLALFA